MQIPLSLSRILPLVALCAMSPALASETITVYGTRISEYANTPHFSDSAELIDSAPGGSVRRNGTLTGIPQYRGLHTYRVHTQVDGRQPHTSGPAWMDSPLHYVPSSLVDYLEVHRGIAPVRAGSSLGGHINVVSVTSRFGSDAAYRLRSRLTLDSHEVDDGANSSVFLSAANDRNRFHLLGVHDEGDDRESGDRLVSGTEYERDYFGFGLGHRINGHEWSLDYARNNTGETGTPSLPMDIDYFRTDLANGRYRGRIGSWDVEAQLHYQHTDHRMTNYHLRPAPDFSAAPLPPFVGDDRRFAQVDGESHGGKWQMRRGISSEGTWTLGVDLRSSETGMVIHDPDFEAFFVDNYSDATVEEYGAFVEWEGPVADSLRGEFGARIHHTRTDADEVRHFRPPPCTDGDPATTCPAPARSLAALSGRFNASDRSRDDTELDVVAVLTRRMSEDLELEFGIGRKTRAPAYMERYLWVPLETNGGLGDGNNYVGDPDLDPEQSLQLEFGAHWQYAGIEVSPRLFYRRVDDYITGIPEDDEDVRRVSGILNGDPTPIRFANVDAEFYGADLGFRVSLDVDWSLSGHASYVRGKLREAFLSQDGSTSVDDDSPDRLPPLQGVLSIERSADDWALTLETEWAARQSKLSRLLTDDPQSSRNRHEEIPGYALWHVRFRYDLPAHGLMLLAGVENLTDREYTDPTSGFNRILGSDIAIGERLPGSGRNAFLRLIWNSGT